MRSDTYIFHLTSHDAWLAAKGGAYRPDGLSTEGFIHCSKASQIVDVANSFYHGQYGLALLMIDPEKLESELKWEPPAGPAPTDAHANDLFPHIYGPLNPGAVVKVLPFEPDEHGHFSLPETLI